MTKLQSLLTELKRLEREATKPGWVWGEWHIYNENREAQKRREPYWTLVEGEELCVGPIGRKSLEPEYVARAYGYEADGISVSSADAKLICAIRNASPVLIEALELAIKYATVFASNPECTKLFDSEFIDKLDAICEREEAENASKPPPTKDTPHARAEKAYASIQQVITLNERIRKLEDETKK